MPVGYAAACYSLRTTEGGRYFLKLWPDTRAGRAAAARRTVFLPLTRALHDRGVYPRVPYPVPTRDGALWASCAGTPYAVFPFIHGRPPEWSATLLDEWARALAAIHRATPALADVLPPRETFDLPFEADLRRGLEATERVGFGARPGLRRLRDLVLPRRADIDAQLERLHGLRRAVRRSAGPFVLCHTDMGGDNLLVDRDGRLWLLDWDDAVVAPPEHDLHEARSLDMARVLRAYGQEGGAQPLQLDHFAFYLLRRYLADTTVRLLSILESGDAEEQDEDALRGIEAWGFAQWSVLNRTLDEIGVALAHANR